MRKLILLAIVIGLLLCPVLTQNVVADDPLMARMNEPIANVLCCCQTRDGGQCCNWQPICVGLVYGCFNCR